MIAREILLFLIVFTTALMVLVFLGIVYMTGTWVKMAERMKQDGTLPKIRRRQFIINYPKPVTQR